MNTKTLDILTTTAGAWPYPLLLIETILGAVVTTKPDKDGRLEVDTFEWPNGRRLPDGVRLLIRDNPASKKDRTYEYLLMLVRQFGPERVLLFSPEWAGEHGHNLDFLLTKSTAEWALAVDSDIQFLDPGWHAKLQEFIAEYPNMEVACEIATANKSGDIAYLPGAHVYVDALDRMDRVKFKRENAAPRRWVPRSTSYFMLFKPEFMRREGVSFGRNDYDVRPVFRDVFPYPRPGFIGEDDQQRWSFDHGWQLLWAGANCNERKPFTLVQIPPKIAATYVHHFHKICGFMLSAGEKPNSPTNMANWGRDIPQLIP